MPLGARYDEGGGLSVPKWPLLNELQPLGERAGGARYDPEPTPQNVGCGALIVPELKSVTMRHMNDAKADMSQPDHSSAHFPGQRRPAFLTRDIAGPPIRTSYVNLLPPQY